MNDAPYSRKADALYAILPSLSILVVSLAVADLRTSILMIPTALLLPLVIHSYRARGLANGAGLMGLQHEAPEIVSLMSVPLHSGEPLESSVRFVAESDTLISAEWFRDLMWRVDTRRVPSVREGINRTSELNDGGSLALSMQLLVAASDATSVEERTELVEEANRVSLEGMRTALDRYASSLNIPAMTVFAVGIVLPLICVSLIPLMSLGAGLGSGFSYGHLATVGMLILPLLVAVYMSKVLSRNPVPPEDTGRTTDILAVLMTIPATFVLAGTGFGPVSSLAVGCVPLCLYAWARLYGRERSRLQSKEGEEQLAGHLLRLGNGLRSGKGLAASLSSEARREGVIGVSVGELIHLNESTRKPMEDIVVEAFSSMPANFVNAYKTAMAAARKDVGQAGMLCIRIGKNLHQRASSREDVRNKLRSLTDMMSGTSTLFAPLVLGIGLSLASPLDQMGQALEPITITITGLYLVELAILTTWIGSRLEGLKGTVTVAFRSASRIPLSLLVFIISWKLLSGGFLAIG